MIDAQRNRNSLFTDETDDDLHGHRLTPEGWFDTRFSQADLEIPGANSVATNGVKTQPKRTKANGKSPPTESPPVAAPEDVRQDAEAKTTDAKKPDPSGQFKKAFVPYLGQFIEPPPHIEGLTERQIEQYHAYQKASLAIKHNHCGRVVAMFAEDYAGKKGNPFASQALVEQIVLETVGQSNPLGRMMVEQLIITHFAIASLSVCAANSVGGECRLAYLDGARKLQAEYRRGMESLHSMFPIASRPK